jgi:hypothetical protein
LSKKQISDRIFPNNPEFYSIFDGLTKELPELEVVYLKHHFEIDFVVVDKLAVHSYRHFV